MRRGLPQQFRDLLLGHGEHTDLERLEIDRATQLPAGIVQGHRARGQACHLEIDHGGTLSHDDDPQHPE